MANNIKTKTTIKSLKDLGSNSQDKHIKRNEMMRNILWDLILYLDANEKIIDNTLIDSVGEEFREKNLALLVGGSKFYQVLKMEMIILFFMIINF